MAGRRRVVKGLVLTACVSRHQFCWPTYGESLPEVIEGFEEGWEFFDGVFRVLIVDYVTRHIIRVLCPPELCGRRRSPAVFRTGGGEGGAGTGPHNVQSDASHLSSDSSDLQTGVVRNAAEEPGGSAARRAASFALVLISA